jgi:tetratricopeptide (TPR) repeat protein
VIALGLVLAAQIVTHLPAPDSYADILSEYQSGNQTLALQQLARLDSEALDAGFEALVTTLSPALGQAAAAMHTEAALRSPVPITPSAAAHHLDLATRLVEKGQPVKGKLTRPLPNSSLWPVTAEFRRLWYITVITTLEGGGQLAPAMKYAAQARELYRDDADVLLLSGIAEEMRASPRTEGVQEGERRKSLERAEQFLRAAVKANPERLEAQLRLGRVLFLRHDARARDVLLQVANAPDPRLRYLSALFLGAVYDAQQDAVSAQTWYAKAVAEMPRGQAAVLAASESRYRTGDVEGAASILAGAVRDPNAADPWWTYVFGDYWRARILLDAVRKGRQR